MNQEAGGAGGAGRILLWICTVLLALGLGLAGVTKFTSATRWHDLFVGWGYPAWFSPVTGIAEIAGAVALLVPRLAAYGALFLAAVMIGALVTLLTHPGGPMGWGATPTTYIVLLAIVGALRRRERAGSARP